MEQTTTDGSFTAVSLFSGCGGLDCGLEQAGVDVALAVDNWEPAVSTYSDNFDSRVIQKDVRELTFDDVVGELDTAGYTPSDIDLVVGGPPCQGFSRLNNEQIELDEMERDDRNTLFEAFARLAGEIDPDIVLMENVRDLISREMSDGTMVKHAIVDVFDQHGFDCEYQVINAADYGVPQKRNRLFFVGTQDGDIVFPEPDSGDRPTAGDALDGVTEDLPNMYFANTSDRILEKIRHVPPGGYYADLPDEYKTRDDDGNIVKRYGTYLRRLAPDEPSLTVSSNEFIHPTKDRYVTPREMARLQTIPDDFEITGTKGDVLTQIGNAIPVELGRRFGEAFVDEYATPTPIVADD